MGFALPTNALYDQFRSKLAILLYRLVTFYGFFSVFLFGRRKKKEEKSL